MATAELGHRRRCTRTATAPERRPLTQLGLLYFHILEAYATDFGGPAGDQQIPPLFHRISGEHDRLAPHGVFSGLIVQ
jgi:hypothetical protein